jgi:Co/Zn/Cd efflux system component
MTDCEKSCACAAAAATAEAHTLRWLLGINTVMFVVEIVTGWIAQSAGLIADSLDMFADYFVRQY